MNKQELIQKVKEIHVDKIFPAQKVLDYSEVFDLLEQLDEPKKVTVPKFVADWIEECKNDDFHLFGAMEGISLNQKKLDYWFREDDNMELFARAWLDGYEVEKKPKYTVKIKSVNQYLVRNTDEDFLGFLQSRLKSKFTRKELEEAGFGEVFNSPLFEVEEVEDDSKI